MNNIRVAIKLPVTILVLALIAVAVSSFVANVKATRALHLEAENKLTALGESRKQAISQYLASIREDLLSIAENGFTVEALSYLETGAADFGDQPRDGLQAAYITGNPHPTGEKHKLDRAEGDKWYHELHGKYHPWFRHFLESRGYYDIFLISVKGDVVYTVFKELDFGTNLKNGQWKDTDLAAVYNGVMENPKKGSAVFKDFKPYAPSNDAPASFIGTPIFDGENLLGVLVFQMPIDRINKVMQISAGMGESGETYLVGEDYLMRSDSRFSTESTILKSKVDTATVKKALDGKRGVQTTSDYRGIPVVSAYDSFDFEGVRYAVMAEIDEAEMKVSVTELQVFLLVGALIVLAVVSIVGVLFARSLTVPVATMTEAMEALADGNLDVDVPAQGRGDEIGSMATAVQVFKDNALRVKQMEAEQAEAARRAEAEKAAALNKMADDFESSVGGIVQTVSSAATEMQSSSQALSATAQQTSAQSSTVAAAAEEASSNVETVATAAEELSASISEISRQVAQSSEVSSSAVEEAERTNTQVQGLADAANRIGEVVNLISDIAEQTNLLALNATIEAARAGEAGKGFAVVASEVKSLANQTAKATEEISNQIGDIQSATQEAVGAIGGISSTIGQINEIASAIAAAVEEQGAATGEIARNVQQASAGTQEVTVNISGVNQAASETGESAAQLMNASAELSEQSERLSVEVSNFLQSVRKG